jgi:glycosyltransferase involved in cell wall biosynthesis
MRIGIDGKRAFHNFRGLGNYSRTLLEGLSTFYPEDSYLLFSPPFKDERALAWQKKFPKFEVKTPDSALMRTFPSAWRSLFLGGDLKGSKLDLYHGLSHELPAGAGKFSFPTVVTMHDLIFMRYPEFFPWIDRQVYARKFEHATKNADIVVAICEQTKIDLIEMLGVPEKKIRVIYQSCSPAFYQRINLEERERVKRKHGIEGDYILYVGALEQRKNALAVVKSMARLRGKTQHKLILIGNGGEYRKEIEREIAGSGLTGQVLILNSVASEDLPAIYQAATMLTFPSFFEGFGIPIVEALFSEIPVITSEGSCFPEAAGPGALYIDPKNDEMLTNAIEQLLGDTELRMELARRGREHVERFHWRETSRQMHELYRSLLRS